MQAIIEAKEKQLDLRDIYAWFLANFAHFRTCNLTWKVKIIRPKQLLHNNNLQKKLKQSVISWGFMHGYLFNLPTVSENENLPHKIRWEIQTSTQFKFPAKWAMKEIKTILPGHWEKQQSNNVRENEEKWNAFFILDSLPVRGCTKLAEILASVVKDSIAFLF